jgi:hypothetical protein
LPNFVSKYAFENRNREDISETFAIWLALRNKENRRSTGDYNKVIEGLSHGVAYLNSLNFDINPIEAKSLSIENFTHDNVVLYPNPIADKIKIIATNNDAKAFVIYNILGAKILEGVVHENKNIPFKQFIKGIYFLKLDKEEKIKFITN